MEFAPPIFLFFMAIFMCSLPAYGLQRPWRGLGLAWLGAILGAGLALGIGFLYIRLVHVERPPRNDADWSGVGVYIYCFTLGPCVGAIAGLVLGFRYAYWREREVEVPLRP
jgi:hypothetical protein